MKTKIKALLIISIIACSYINYKVSSHSKGTITDSLLNNVEALADDKENSGDKKFRYQTWHNEDCYIYVGGAYAKGKKVSCYDGNEHPICVDCTL